MEKKREGRVLVGGEKRKGITFSLCSLNQTFDHLSECEAR